ncbi:MAG TPA: peptide-methionine (S)-S-oxide reductase MsrA [Allosphingosinicella sp.]|nr:peptide-methionine (S)-S-oxide reductase MsrA [Allosphingosinicella sp.]
MKRLSIALTCLFVAIAAMLLMRGGSPLSAASPPRLASAVFAGGCFWCTESDFDHVPGVVSTTSGYSGGRVANPTYEQVSAGGTGHYESVKVVYDPAKVSYRSLVARFFKTVDAVDGGGQFCDRGSQYRSAIFVANPEQRRIAEEVKARAAALLKKPVATQILPAAPFYAAEAYHQDYYRKNPVRYRYYRWRCGRDARLKALWGA